MMSIPTPPVAKPSANQLLVERGAAFEGDKAAKPSFQPILVGPGTVWVIMPDYHCEGLREPIAAFQTKARADQAMALLAHGHQSFKLVEVEIQDA